VLVKEVKFKRVVYSEAMSKRPRQSGIKFTKVDKAKYSWRHSNDCILVEAYNTVTKEVTSHLSMEIPLEHLDEVIKALQELKND